MMYTVTWWRYPHGIEGEEMDCKSKDFNNLEKVSPLQMLKPKE